MARRASEVEVVVGKVVGIDVRGVMVSIGRIEKKNSVVDVDSAIVLDIREDCDVCPPLIAVVVVVALGSSVIFSSEARKSALNLGNPSPTIPLTPSAAKSSVV